MKPTKRKFQGQSRSSDGLNDLEGHGGIDVESQLEESRDKFHYSEGLTSAEADMILRTAGRNELPEKTVSKLWTFICILFEPMPVMIWLAIIIEAAISKWMDMSILIAIQFANASIAFYESTQAGNAVAALKASLRPLATVKRDGIWQHIDAAVVVPGDLVLLATGSAVPADCRINNGTVEIDQAALTGESLPAAMFKGDSCKMGSTVVRGEVEGTVEFTGVNTFFGKTAMMLQVIHLFPCVCCFVRLIDWFTGHQ